jgi:hypothetical protein
MKKWISPIPFAELVILDVNLRFVRAAKAVAVKAAKAVAVKAAKAVAVKAMVVKRPKNLRYLEASLYVLKKMRG